MNYLNAFQRTVRCHPDDAAILTDDGRRLTYAELHRRSTRLADALHSRAPGGRCAVLTLNGVPAVESMIAAHKRGTAVVQLPFRSGPDELRSMMDSADAEALLFDDHNAEKALELLDRGSFEAAIHAGSADVDHPDVESYEDVLSAASPDSAAALPDGDECAVFYTSGTTSVPKAVLFDGEQMWYGATQVVMEHGIEETDVALVTTPWYHMVTSDAWIYPHLLAGATLVIQTSFDPDEALELVAEHDVTGLLAVPTQLNGINDAQEEAGYDADSLRYIRTGGSVVRPELVERTSDLLTENVYNTYGMTEGGPNFTFAHPSVQAEHTGTIGKESFSWELRVVKSVPLSEEPDPEATVDPGERGEILARGPGMSTGYLDNPEAEEKSYTAGGEWLRTRDVAEVDEEGYLYIVDRVDNMIISGGENVYPEEVESALERHDAVDEAVVVGVPDDEWGQVVCGVVVTDGSVDEDDLDEFCYENDGLADFKRPRRYVLREEPLPRTDTGTIERERVLKEHFEEG